MSLKTWAENKKIKSSDLDFMKALKTNFQENFFNQIADQVALKNPTFSQGLQIFESLTDLILMGHEETLLQNLDSIESYQTYLKSLRYPHTTQRDENLKLKFESLPWPYGSQFKFQRRGDRAGVELKVFISSSVDLIKIMASLERVQKELEK